MKQKKKKKKREAHSRSPLIRGLEVCTEYHKNQTKITPPVPRKAVITKMPAIPEVEEQITPVVTKIGPYAIKKTGVQKLIVNPKWSLKRVEMGVQGLRLGRACSVGGTLSVH
ncbi:hypothetical protein DUI87_01887 [Hirundo rustica rustica]|uniref:Uncharacterized protein n=1 Tax=Hirundo rustica rustica TaxID=333673 RepID=A0A3M0L7F7_HIRRU|nr:hypothetical protein DUI87_01887 [Hirundo rustica rustica]